MREGVAVPRCVVVTAVTAEVRHPCRPVEKAATTWSTTPASPSTKTWGRTLKLIHADRRGRKYTRRVRKVGWLAPVLTENGGSRRKLTRG